MRITLTRTRPRAHPRAIVSQFNSCAVSGPLHDSALRKRRKGKYFYWLHMCQYCWLKVTSSSDNHAKIFNLFIKSVKDESKKGCSPCQPQGWIQDFEMECEFKFSVSEKLNIYFNIWGIRKKKEGGSEKGGMKIHPFHLAWIRACWFGRGNLGVPLF